MNEITRITLENEMDLILAHRQSMKLISLTGLSLAAQTTFATAVSEIARIAIDKCKTAHLIFFISDKKEKKKEVIAIIKDGADNFINYQSEGYIYAKKLVDDIDIICKDGTTTVEMHFNIPHTFRIDNEQLEKWKILFNNDPEITPYEEIKRKNNLLIDLSNRLKESEGLYRVLTNSLPLMIFTLTAEGKVTYANKWLEEYTGRTLAMLNDTNWKDVLHPDDRMDVRTQWHAIVVNNLPVTIECRLKDGRNNEYRWYTGIATPIINENSRVQYWTAYLADIHAQKMIESTLKDNVELKEAQAQLKQKVIELNKSNQQLEQFAYVASHDLQEPLRKISFYSDFLKNKYESELPGESNTLLNNIIKAAERMKGLIQDILAYSTITKDTKTFSKCDLNNIAHEAIHDLEIAIKEKDAKVTIDLLPVIEGRQNQLKQLFENLLSNSLKYISDVKPVIHISAQVNDDNTVLYFKDNGIGFEEKYLNKMFALFQRLHGREQYSGTGIGLSICKKIVELHKGQITAKSQPGKGATFIITLPLSQYN